MHPLDDTVWTCRGEAAEREPQLKVLRYVADDEVWVQRVWPDGPLYAAMRASENAPFRVSLINLQTAYEVDVRRSDVRPRFEHDCEACVFIGRYADHDLYRCPQNELGRPTIVARWGSAGPDYTSGPVVDLGGIEIRIKRGG